MDPIDIRFMNTGLARTSSVLKMAWIIFSNRTNFSVYFLLGIIPLIVMFAVQFILFRDNYSIPLAVIKGIVDSGGGPLVLVAVVGCLAILFVLLISWYYCTLFTLHTSLVYSQPKSIREYLRIGWQKTGHFVATSIIRNVVIFFGLLALVIPGLLFFVWYQFTPMIAGIEGKDTDAFKTSKHIVQKFFWPLFARQIII